jgi:hypothetical protein
MFSIHSIRTIKAKASETPATNWLELTITDGTETSTLSLYFTSNNNNFAEEHRFACELAAAINSVHPIQNRPKLDPEGNIVEHLEAVGLNPVVIDEDTDFGEPNAS